MHPKIKRLLHGMMGLAATAAGMPLAVAQHAETTDVAPFRIVQFNVENLFSPQGADSTLRDDPHRLSPRRYREKLIRIAELIAAVGESRPPALIALCEVENHAVLHDLTASSLTPLATWHYGILHRESPDRRGMDVALLYRPERFSPIVERYLAVALPGDTAAVTRDILYAAGRLPTGDTLHVFVNHWPSHRGGTATADALRHAAARTLRHAVDSVQRTAAHPLIVALGDFNDTPLAGVLYDELRAVPAVGAAVQPDTLYNLMLAPEGRFMPLGSYRFRGVWDFLDQIIVSGALLQRYTCPDKVHVFSAAVLFEEGEISHNSNIKRTFAGEAYHGGISDHLPVYLDLDLHSATP